MNEYKWGIIGPGNIANTFAESMSVVSNGTICAVASRSLNKSKEFAKKWSVDRFYGTYEDLFKDDEVDIVYISTVHRYHYENIKMALNNGKSVFCEKPITVNARELKELLLLAKEKNLFLMEALWSKFLPTFQHLKKNWLAENLIGKIKRIEADFSFHCPYNASHRMFNPELAGGALLDIGIYPLTFALWIMEIKPDQLVSLCRKCPSGVDAESVLTLMWSSGETAILTISANYEGSRKAQIWGSEGSIELSGPFHGGEKMILRKEGQEKEFHMKHKMNGFEFQIEEVHNCLDNSLIESPEHNWSTTLQMMEIMDDLRGQWELVYPFE